MSECEWCHEELDSEEKENPRKSTDEEIICDNCFDDEYNYRCVLCLERFPKIEWKYFLIEDPRKVGLDQEGIYEIIGKPFFSSDILGSSFYIFKDKVKWVCRLRENKDIYWGTKEVCSDCVTGFATKPVDQEGG